MFTFGKVYRELRREGGRERGSFFAAFVQGVCANGEWEASTRAEVVTSLLDAQFCMPTVFAGVFCWDTCVENQKTLPAHFVDGRHATRDCEYWLLCSLFHTKLFSCLSVICFLLTLSQQQRRRPGLHERRYQNVVFHPVVFSFVSRAGV